MAAARTAGLRTTPPFATCSRPASNCGFTRTSARHGEAARARAGASTSVSEMNDTSATTRSGRYGRSTAARSRALVRSSTVTRGSVRSRSWSWPYPTSTAITAAAPRCSRQSVNPPVEAPRSRARAPVTSQPNVSSAVASLPPARDTYGGGAATSIAASSATRVPAFVTTCPSTRTWPAITSPCARPRVSTSPRATSATSSRSLRGPPRTSAHTAGASVATCAEAYAGHARRDARGPSPVAREHALGDLRERLGPPGERRDQLTAAGRRRRLELARAVDPEHRHERALVVRRVRPRRLAERLVRAGRVEHVVDDLEAEPELVGEREVGALRRPRRPRQREPGGDRGADQPPRLERAHPP